MWNQKQEWQKKNVQGRNHKAVTTIQPPHPHATPQVLSEQSSPTSTSAIE